MSAAVPTAPPMEKRSTAEGPPCHLNGYRSSVTSSIYSACSQSALANAFYGCAASRWNSVAHTDKSIHHTVSPDDVQSIMSRCSIPLPSPPSPSATDTSGGDPSSNTNQSSSYGDLTSGISGAGSSCSVYASSNPSSSSSSLSTPLGNSSAPSTRTPSSTTKNRTGAIVGGVLGGLALILLAVVVSALLVRRHRRAVRLAPSAEFMHLARGRAESSDEMKHAAMPANSHFVSLAGPGQIPADEDEGPPLFTPGSFKDPVLEKVSASGTAWHSN